MYDAPERSVRGLKDGPTRSRAARRPPTRSRVPWTRRTSPLSGRSPPSMFRIPLAPPRTAGAWSSAPAGASGRTLRREQERKATFVKRRTPSSSAGAVFLSSPLDVCPGSTAWFLGRNTYSSPVAPRFFPWSTSSPSSHAGPDGPVAAQERRRLGLLHRRVPTG